MFNPGPLPAENQGGTAKASQAGPVCKSLDSQGKSGDG